MGLRFRQSFQLFPGVRINVSGSGVSATFGVPGASINLGSKGVRSTIGLPGTDLFYTHDHSLGGLPALRSRTNDRRRISRACPCFKCARSTAPPWRI